MNIWNQKVIIFVRYSCEFDITVIATTELVVLIHCLKFIKWIVRTISLWVENISMFTHKNYYVNVSWNHGQNQFWRKTWIRTGTVSFLNKTHIYYELFVNFPSIFQINQISVVQPKCFLSPHTKSLLSPQYGEKWFKTTI